MIRSFFFLTISTAIAAGKSTAKSGSGSVSSSLDSSSNGNSNNIPVPWTLPFNNTVGLGPDGPWHFLTMSIGGNSVDMFPAFGPGSNLLIQSHVCDQSSLSPYCPSPQPQFYETSTTNKTLHNASLYNTDIAGVQTQLTGDIIWEWRNDFDVPFNNSLIQNQLSNDTVFNLPTRTDIQSKYVPMSLLTLEPVAAHPASAGNNGKTLLENYVDAASAARVAALTMGSPAHGLPGSLLFGGYDRSRVIEPAASFMGSSRAVDLTSISFGTDTSRGGGVSPWANVPDLPANFAQSDTTNTTGLQPILSPQSAYIDLPAGMCAEMARYLPVNLDVDGTGLYLWDTTDPAYEAIISSPSYLNFTFTPDPSSSDSTAPVSVRVPFTMLNLTLAPPLKKTPTPYFPCRPIALVSADSNGGHLPVTPVALGRAFMQAAYVVEASTPQTVLVAQAPGPKNLAAQDGQAITPNPPNQADSPPASIQAMANPPSWIDTWAGVLTPLSSPPATLGKGGRVPAPSSSSGSSPNSDGGSGTGGSAIYGGSAAEAGIIVGVVIGAGLIGGLVAYFVVRHRRNSRAKRTAEDMEKLRADKNQSLTSLSSMGSGMATDSTTALELELQQQYQNDSLQQQQQQQQQRVHQPYSGFIEMAADGGAGTGAAGELQGLGQVELDGGAQRVEIGDGSGRMSRWESNSQFDSILGYTYPYQAQPPSQFQQHTITDYDDDNDDGAFHQSITPRNATRPTSASTTTTSSYQSTTLPTPRQNTYTTHSTITSFTDHSTVRNINTHHRPHHDTMTTSSSSDFLAQATNGFADAATSDQDPDDMSWSTRSDSRHYYDSYTHPEAGPALPSAAYMRRGESGYGSTVGGTSARTSRADSASRMGSGLNWLDGMSVAGSMAGGMAGGRVDSRACSRTRAESRAESTWSSGGIRGILDRSERTSLRPSTRGRGELEG